MIATVAELDVEPMPGDEGYEAFKIFEAHKDAYWSAVTRGEIAMIDGLPDVAGSRTDAGLLDAGQRAERLVAQAEGEKLAAVAEFALRSIANPAVGYDETAMMRSVEAEVGFAFRISSAAAHDLLHLAMTLARRLPRTFAALKSGKLGLRKVKAIADETLNLDVAQCARLEDTVLPEAETRTVRSLKEMVRAEVEKIDADAVRKRRESAKADRTLYVKDEHDGMATLCLYLPAEQARAIYDTINSRITAQRTGPDDERLIGARRADHLVDLLVAAFGVDLRAVADTDSPVLTAEQIARLNRGANSYVPSEAMKNAIRARDKHCRFPGCRRPAVHCDIDHTNSFNLALKAGGRTIYTNLGAVCRFHHQVKQMPGWHLSQDDHGNFSWTDPGGRVFVTRPPPADGDEPPEFWAPEAGAHTYPF
ncbi:HNH endonuclease signature motif containing protein [Sporichthya sp.]|uniref:HNH endonuclease signature motif containing protein n=1 Tax=Sporichthya sp. TaxID=65475 RepID=UPI0018102D99|nr:HNH endonuclease signature motif containing protein [Sporichthya sp.]MBA3745718.1 DUF222 domain-containing protein [Sporichthya sp.]